MANAYCERVIGTFRRECLDYLIPINQQHLRRIVREFADYYNRGRPHSALGPGLPEPNQATAPPKEQPLKERFGGRVLWLVLAVWLFCGPGCASQGAETRWH